MSSNPVENPGFRPQQEVRPQRQEVDPILGAAEPSLRPTSSPRWTSTTKLLMGLIIVGIVAFLLYRFTSLITPLLMVFILAYLLQPVATLMMRRPRITYEAAVLRHFTARLEEIADTPAVTGAR